MDTQLPMVYFITTPDKKTALELANVLVKKKIVACANIIENITSVYWWEDKINTDQECIMVVKTVKNQSDTLIEYVQNIHPYEVPECIGINIAKGSKPYQQWIVDSTKED